MCCIPWCYTLCCEPRKIYRLFKRRKQRGYRSDNSTGSSDHARIVSEKRPREREREQRKKRRSQSTGREKRRKSPSSSTEGYHGTPHIIVAPVVIPPPPPADFEQWNPTPEPETFARLPLAPPTPVPTLPPHPPAVLPTPQRPVNIPPTPPPRPATLPPTPPRPATVVEGQVLSPSSSPPQTPVVTHQEVPTRHTVITPPDLAQYLLPPSTIGPVDEVEQRQQEQEPHHYHHPAPPAPAPVPCVDVEIYSSPTSRRRERSVSRHRRSSSRPRSSYGSQHPRDSHHSLYSEGSQDSAIPPIPTTAERDRSVYIDQTRKRRSQPEPLARMVGGHGGGGGVPLDFARGQQPVDHSRGQQSGDAWRGQSMDVPRGQQADFARGQPLVDPSRGLLVDVRRGHSMDMPRGQQADYSRGYPLDASQGQPVDVQHGQTVDFSRQPADSTRGQPVDARRGQSVDAHWGQSVDTYRGQSIDLPRGQPLDVHRGQSVDAHRGQSVDVPRNQPVDYSRERPVDFPCGHPADPPRGQPVDVPQEQTELDLDDFVSNVESLAREAIEEDVLRPKWCFVRERREQEEREREERERRERENSGRGINGDGQREREDREKRELENSGRRTLGERDGEGQRERKPKSSANPQGVNITITRTTTTTRRRPQSSNGSPRSSQLSNGSPRTSQLVTQPDNQLQRITPPDSPRYASTEGQQDYHDYQPRPQPKVSFAYDENGPIPRTYKELRDHLSSHIVSQGLEAIIPSDSPDPITIARKAEVEADRICASLGISAHATSDLTKVGLYDIIVFCDDSGSMHMDNRFDDQKSIVQRISRIAQTYNQSGISLRFINFLKDDGYNNLSHGKINTAMSNVFPNGTTRLGTKLLEKVIFPFVIEPAQRKELKKPVLISIITDGEPTEEDIDTFKWSILACKNELRKLVTARGMPYGKAAVTFQISQIGDSIESKRFLDRLAHDPEVGDLIFCSDETLDTAVRQAGPDSGALNTWLTQLLAGAVTV